jgi:carbamoyltransferase
MIVLGISCYFHDAAAALVINGKLVAAAQEERFSRIKHDSNFPEKAIQFCLEEAGLTADDLDHVVFYEKPLLKFERILVTHLRTFPFGLGQFIKSMALWLTKRLWLGRELALKIGVTEEQVLYSRHHLSHAASTYLTSDVKDAAILTVDGVGEWNSTAIFHGQTTSEGTSISPIEEQHFPHSLGLLYSAFTAYLGFRVNEGECKVMGMAPYGTPKYRDAIDSIVQLADDGSVTLDMDYFCFDRSATKSFTKKLENLLGPARKPESLLEFPALPDGDVQRFADVAASIQSFLEDALLKLAQHAHALTGSKNLCLAGGVALNSVANRRIAEEGPFDAIHVHPAAGDAGGAAGAALYISNVIAGDPRHVMQTPLLGRAIESTGVKQFLDDCHVRYADLDEATLAKEVAHRLANGQVGAFCMGRFEWGPRALGARSILADPELAGTRDRVNAKIKFRESFRPFAPAVLEEEAHRYFDLGRGADKSLLPHMLSVLPVKQDAQEKLQAVTHIDGTARVQVVNRESSPYLHEVLKAFQQQTGRGVLLNTSLNLKGEPPVASIADAYATFIRSELDFLILEGCLIVKSDANMRGAEPTLEHQAAMQSQVKRRAA